MERERTRIARDIHDDLGANLTRVSMLSQPSASELKSMVDPSNRLDLIFNTTREMIRAMDEIVWAVNPEHDTLESVTNYLARLTQTHLVAANIRCRLHFPIDVPAGRIQAEARHNLYLAFKEAINNILKHSDATEVRLSLELTDHVARFYIEDNGVGPGGESNNVRIKSANDRIVGGMGMDNMKSRLESVGGACEIRRGKLGGAEVVFSIPVDYSLPLEPPPPRSSVR
jgi:signal transduction histidine kinase